MKNMRLKLGGIDMMPYEVGKTFIIRVPLLSIETYKELCSEKDNDAL